MKIVFQAVIHFYSSSIQDFSVAAAHLYLKKDSLSKFFSPLLFSKSKIAGKIFSLYVSGSFENRFSAYSFKVINIGWSLHEKLL